MNNIAVVYGGYSSEREISIKSGKYVASIIDKNKFRVFEIDINKKSWLAVDYQKQINKADFSLQIGDEKIYFDAAVIVIHGNPGENGVLQAYFDMLQIPYTSCNTLSSALTFNKFYANNFLRSFDIKIAKSIVLRNGDREQEKLQKFIDGAIQLIEDKRESDRKKLLKLFNDDLKIIKDRWGRPCIYYKKKYYKLPKETDIEKMTEKDCLKIIEES
jgi:D-alanine--D-alanine ligase